MSAVMLMAQRLEDASIEEVLLRSLLLVMDIYRGSDHVFGETLRTDRFFRQHEDAQSSPACCAIEASESDIRPGLLVRSGVQLAASGIDQDRAPGIEADGHQSRFGKIRSSWPSVSMVCTFECQWFPSGHSK